MLCKRNTQDLVQNACFSSKIDCFKAKRLWFEHINSDLYTFIYVFYYFLLPKDHLKMCKITIISSYALPAKSPIVRHIALFNAFPIIEAMCFWNKKLVLNPLLFGRIYPYNKYGYIGLAISKLGPVTDISRPICPYL
jgi:hypothetical protein